MSAFHVSLLTNHQEIVDVHGHLCRHIYPDIKKMPTLKEGETFLLTRANKPRAMVTAFSCETMKNTQRKTRILGFYEALSEQDGTDLLRHVETHMQAQGDETLIGPMNKNTWGQYRFALPKDPHDPHFSPERFFGGVYTHEHYPKHFEKVGFRPISHYESRVNPNLHIRHYRREEIAGRLKAQGITIDAIDMAQFDDVLKEIFVLSLEGFSNNKFFEPIEFDYFKSLYQGITSIIDPMFFLLARDQQGKLVGFIFAYQDPMAHEKRVILKSMTIDKTVRGMGLGLFLMEEIQRIAYERKFLMAIHALMYIDNTTQGISEGGMKSVLFRRYALYKKSLAVSKV